LPYSNRERECVYGAPKQARIEARISPKQKRLFERAAASWAVFVEAIGDGAATFYRKYDLIELPEDKHKLFLPMTTIAKLFTI
jgi:uncharacterized protein (DUF1778 family)